MAASWSRLRQWYRSTGEKLYKTHRGLSIADMKNLNSVAVRFFTETPALQKDAFHKIQYTLQTSQGHKKDTASPLPSAYSPQFVEAVWYDWWFNKGFFSLETQDPPSCAKERFLLLLPPPNVTGTLHLGHALTCSIQDSLVRWHRMRGHTTLWVPGSDHAGIATQVVVEKSLWAQHQQTRHQLGRQQFVTEVWKWKEDQGAVIEEQMKRLGSSLDWNRNFFTLDENLSRAVTEAFVRLHESGKIYRDTQLVNWSCCLRSSISDIEVDNVAVQGRTRRQVPGYEEAVEFGVLSSFAYPLEDSDEEIVVSTTRLETMLGDTAVAVHPEDPRYSKLLGRRVRHPLCGRSIPIIADSFVSREFGSGAVKITPGHDFVDLEVGRRHNLPELSILDDEGKTCGQVGQQFQGLKRFVARQKVRDALLDMGLYRGEVDHEMILPVCSRSGDVVEPRLKEQWFVRCQEMAQRAIQAVQSGELSFSAPHHEAVWFEWLNNVKDWCVSRQLWWGHRIPAYKLQVGWNEDVLDTWFSSALLPFSVFGWPDNTAELKQLYPLTMMETGHDILFFWVARMVMLGLELTDSLPFQHVLLHGIIRDAQGRKMSKSLGNVIDPMDVIEGASLQDLHSRLDSTRLSKAEMELAKQGQKTDFPEGIPECGADALRFTLCSYDFKADEIRLSVLHVRAYRLFCNKIWQAFRFVQQHLPADFAPSPLFTLAESTNAVDRWLLSRLSDLVSRCDAAFTACDLHHATSALHKFWITEFCDVYLECSKAVLWSQNANEEEAVQQILYHTSNTFLRALAPFMPFLAEELFQRLPVERDWPDSVSTAAYPQPADYPWRDEVLEQVMGQVQNICYHILSIRHDYNITKVFTPVYVVMDGEGSSSAVQECVTVLCQLAKAKPVHFVSTSQAVPPGCITAMVDSTCQVHVHLQGHIDLSFALERLSHKRDKVAKSRDKIKAKLSNLMGKSKSHVPAIQKLQEKEALLAADLENITSVIDKIIKMQDGER
ncbi:hypothetical protein BaRGS_00033910 [Batillaria attramentaria]|uniref:valine--tRNA ligase n=1 Tax=Batillaria attramentaria TaxID=370345 RepID=A0ABD0JJB1_9CAEN